MNSKPGARFIEWLPTANGPVAVVFPAAWSGAEVKDWLKSSAGAWVTCALKRQQAAMKKQA